MIKLLSIKDSSCGASTDLGLPEPGVSTKVVSTGRLKVWASLLLLLLLLKEMEKEKKICGAIQFFPLIRCLHFPEFRSNGRLAGVKRRCILGLVL